jgi:hypothetical protein
LVHAPRWCRPHRPACVVLALKFVGSAARPRTNVDRDPNHFRLSIAGEWCGHERPLAADASQTRGRREARLRRRGCPLPTTSIASKSLEPWNGSRRRGEGRSRRVRALIGRSQRPPNGGQLLPTGGSYPQNCIGSIEGAGTRRQLKTKPRRIGGAVTISSSNSSSRRSLSGSQRSAHCKCLLPHCTFAPS